MSGTEEIFAEVMRDAEVAFERKELVGAIPSGISALDLVTGGFRPGDFIVVASRPGMGKTAFCVNVALHNAYARRRRVAFISAKDDSSEIALRMLCAEARVAPYRMRCGELTIKEMTRLLDVSKRMSTSPLEFHGPGYFSKLMHENRERPENPSLLILDDVSPDWFGDRSGDAIGGRAASYEIPIIVTCPIDRQIESTIDSLATTAALPRNALAGTGDDDWGDAADLVIMIHRPEMKFIGITDAMAGGSTAVELRILKNSRGPCGRIEGVTLDRNGRLEEVQKEPL